MNIEIINVGTELLLGEIVNTNATTLQKICKDLGFNVFYQTVVGDNPDRFMDCLDIAFKRGADMVITTGGLGPTADDVTKELSAKYLGLEMEYLEEEAKKVYDKCAFVMNNPDVPSTNFKQAYFPIGAYILENEVGTANGCVMQKGNKRIANLPGPPKEFTYVLNHALVPYLEKEKQKTIFTYDINTMVIGESNMAEKLKDLIDHQDEVTIALYAYEDHCRCRLGVQAFNQEEADQIVASTKQQAEAILKPWIVDYDHLNEVVFKQMKPFKLICDNKLQGPLDAFFKNPLLKDTYQGLTDQIELNEDTIEIKIKTLSLGEQVEINYYHGQHDQDVVNLLKDASLSIGKLEGKIIIYLYQWLFH